MPGDMNRLFVIALNTTPLLRACATLSAAIVRKVSGTAIDPYGLSELSLVRGAHEIGDSLFEASMEAACNSK